MHTRMAYARAGAPCVHASASARKRRGAGTRHASTPRHDGPRVEQVEQANRQAAAGCFVRRSFDLDASSGAGTQAGKGARAAGKKSHLLRGEKQKKRGSASIF